MALAWTNRRRELEGSAVKEDRTVEHDRRRRRMSEGKREVRRGREGSEREDDERSQLDEDAIATTRRHRKCFDFFEK